jgi:hypothetical protein
MALRLVVQSLAAGKSAITIAGATGNEIILIGPSGTKGGVVVTLNGVKQTPVFPTSPDIFITSHRGYNQVRITGSLARTARLHAIGGSVHVTRTGRSGSVSYTLRGTPSRTPTVFGAALVRGPMGIGQGSFSRAHRAR